VKALMKTEPQPGSIKLMDVDRPKIGSEEILVKVKAAAICGSDLGIYDWTASFHWLPLPLIIGHEYAGEIAEVGQTVRDLRVGERVTGLAALGCGICLNCRMGRTNICVDRKILGLHMNGVFAEYVKVPARYVHRLPDNLSYVEAAPTEAMATSAHTVLERASVSPDSTVAILGPGPIGLFALQFLKLFNVKKTIITGLTADERRLKIAEELGADIIINVDQEDPISRVKEEMEGVGADIVFEASGNPLALQQAVHMVKRGGEIVLIGHSSKPAQIASVDLVRGAITMKGTYAYTMETFKKVLDLMSQGKVQSKPVITHILSLEEFNQAFEAAKSREAAKVVFKID